MTSQRIDPDVRLSAKTDQHFLRTMGVILVIAGLIFALDQMLQSGWLTLMVVPMVCLVAFIGGIRQHRMSWVIPAALVGGLGLGTLAILGRIGDVGIFFRVGLFLLC